MDNITVNNHTVEIRQYNGQKVLTFKDIDLAHGRPEGTAKRNFQANKKHFIESEDYFLVKPSDFQKDEIRTFETSNRGTIFVTESGYLMIVKSFTDDLSWNVQRFLVNSYFRAKEEKPKYVQQKVLNDGYEYFDKTFRGRAVYTLADVEHIANTSLSRVKYYLKMRFSRGNDYIILENNELFEYKNENPRVTRRGNAACLLNENAFEKMCNIFTPNSEVSLFTDSEPETVTQTHQTAPQTIQKPTAQPDYSKRITALTTLVLEMQKDLNALSARVSELENKQ